MNSTRRSCQREYKRDWRLRNVVRERAKSLVWYCEDIERAQRNQREWSRRNSVPSRTAARQWQINNLERVRIDRARRRGTLLATATAEFAPKQLAQRWAYYGDKCWICRAEATETDHVKPDQGRRTHALQPAPDLQFMQLRQTGSMAVGPRYGEVRGMTLFYPDVSNNNGPAAKTRLSPRAADPPRIRWCRP